MRPDRPEAPFGRRETEVTDSHRDGGYRVFTLHDELGPEPIPGQFYMLANAPDWPATAGRPYLPRAISFARSDSGDSGITLDFIIHEVGPGTSALAGLAEGDRCWLAGPFGRPFSIPEQVKAGSHGAILVGGGIGIAPIAAFRRRLVEAGVPSRTLLGFRDAEHSGGIDDFFGCEQVGLAFEDGSRGHHGYVTDLLATMLAGDDTGGAVVYSCGPPGLLEKVRQMCAEGGVSCELALESPMACGFGACFGCAVPKPDGSYLRLCVDGAVVRGDEISSAAPGEIQ